MTLKFSIPRLRERAQHEMSRASRVADDAGRQVSGIGLPSMDLGATIDGARKAIGEARRTLGEGSEQVAARAEQVGSRAGQVGNDLRGSLGDLRQLRITREKKRGRDPWPGLALIGGIAGGVAAMFLLDPKDGQRRRAMVRNKATQLSHVAQEKAQQTAKDLRERSQGLMDKSQDIVEKGQGLMAETRDAIAGRLPGMDDDSDAAVSTEWPAKEPVGAAVGGGTDSQPTFGDVEHQPGAPNGREA